MHAEDDDQDPIGQTKIHNNYYQTTNLDFDLVRKIKNVV